MSKLHTILTVLVAVIVVGTVAIPIINQYAAGNVEYETVVTDRENTGQAFYMSPSTGSYTLKSDGTAPDMWAVSDSFSLNVAGGNINLTTADQKLSDLIQTDDGSGDEGKVVKVLSYNGNVGYLMSNGDLYASGSNTYGQLGTGNTTSVNSFIKIASNVADFVLGEAIAYITTSGDLYGAGKNSYMMIDNSDPTVLTFVKIASNVSKVYVGISNIFYLTTSGDLYGRGGNSDYQLAETVGTSVSSVLIASNVVDFSANNGVSLVYLTTSGDLYGRGDNANGNIAESSLTQVKTNTLITSDVESFAVNNGSTFMVVDGVAVQLTGGSYGELDLQGVKTVIAGGNGNVTPTYIILDDGSLYVHGYDPLTQSAFDGTEFVASNVTKAYVSSGCGLYLTTSGDLYGVGEDSWLGALTEDYKISGGVSDAALLSSGYTSTVTYITTSGDLYGAGLNTSGQLGIPDASQVDTYQKIASGGNSEPVDLSYTVTVGAGRVTLVQTEQTLLDVPYTVLYVNSTTGDYAAYLPTSSTPVYADADSDIYLMGTDSWADGSPSGVSGSAGSTITASDYKGARQITAASPSGSYVVAPVGYTTTEQVVIGGVEASPMVKTMFGLLPVLMLVAVLLGIIRAYRQ